MNMKKKKKNNINPLFIFSLALSSLYTLFSAHSLKLVDKEERYEHRGKVKEEEEKKNEREKERRETKEERYRRMEGKLKKRRKEEIGLNGYIRKRGRRDTNEKRQA